MHVRMSSANSPLPQSILSIYVWLEILFLLIHLGGSNCKEINEQRVTDITLSNLENRNENSLPTVACELGGHDSPIQKSNLLQFEYTSPDYPTTIGDDSAGLCVLRIDHNWKFGPRNNNATNGSGNSTSMDDTESSDYYSVPDDEDFYEELCGLSIEPITGEGEEGNEESTTGEEGGEEGQQQKPKMPKQKPKICQVRLDLLDFQLQPPILGDCRFDKMFTLSGSGNDYPILCGWNGGHHMYLDVADRAATDLTFVIKQLKEEMYSCLDRFDVVTNLNRNSSDEIFESSTEEDRGEHKPVQVPVKSEEDTTLFHFNRDRKWRIRVTQLPCGCSKFEKEMPKAPAGCLMYYPNEVSGTIKSFNYDHVGCYSHEHVCDVSDLSSCSMTAGFTGHLNNLDYSICVEQQYGFCGVEYSAADPAEIGPFSLSNTTKTSTSIDEQFGAGGAASGDKNCLTDYLILHGGHCKNDKTHYETDRFCGNSLGVSGGGNAPGESTGSPTDLQTVVSFKKPFHVQVVTDSDEITASVDYMNRGFHLKYHQLPCQ